MTHVEKREVMPEFLRAYEGLVNTIDVKRKKDG